MRTCLCMKPDEQVDLAWSIRSGESGPGSDGPRMRKAPATGHTVQNTIQLNDSRHIEEMETLGYSPALLRSEELSADHGCHPGSMSGLSFVGCLSAISFVFAAEDGPGTTVSSQR